MICYRRFTSLRTCRNTRACVFACMCNSAGFEGQDAQLKTAKAEAEVSWKTRIGTVEQRVSHAAATMTRVAGHCKRATRMERILGLRLCKGNLYHKGVLYRVLGAD